VKSLEPYDAEIVDLLTLSPFDEENGPSVPWRKPASRHRPRGAGPAAFGAELAATIAERPSCAAGPVLRVADLTFPVPLAKLVEHYLPTPPVSGRGRGLLRY
jgi:pyruvate dehydrogenase E1 component beta subunit